METTNNLRFNVTKESLKETFVINIRLNDECKNGHNDFSITGTIYEKGKAMSDRYMISGGAIGDEIAKKFPSFKIFNDLHLCDAKGAPMYAIGNGIYHMVNTGKEVSMNYLRINEDEFEILSLTTDDEIYFQFTLESLGIHKRWEREANTGIEELERLTGKKFKDDSKRYEFTPLTVEQITDVKRKIEAGYYSVTMIQQRRFRAIENAREKIAYDLLKHRDSEIYKENREYNVKIAVHNAGLSLENFIYYGHTNEGVFNWRTDSFHKAITKSEFDQFLTAVDYKNLPDGIQFKIKQ